MLQPEEADKYISEINAGCYKFKERFLGLTCYFIFFFIRREQIKKAPCSCCFSIGGKKNTSQEEEKKAAALWLVTQTCQRDIKKTNRHKLNPAPLEEEEEEKRLQWLESRCWEMTWTPPWTQRKNKRIKAWTYERLSGSTSVSETDSRRWEISRGGGMGLAWERTRYCNLRPLCSTQYKYFPILQRPPGFQPCQQRATTGRYVMAFLSDHKEHVAGRFGLRLSDGSEGWRVQQGVKIAPAGRGQRLSATADLSPTCAWFNGTKFRQRDFFFCCHCCSPKDCGKVVPYNDASDMLPWGSMSLPVFIISSLSYIAS